MADKPLDEYATSLLSILYPIETENERKKSKGTKLIPENIIRFLYSISGREQLNHISFI
jgi:hypothetical protein